MSIMAALYGWRQLIAFFKRRTPERSGGLLKGSFAGFYCVLQAFFMARHIVADLLDEFSGRVAQPSGLKLETVRSFPCLVSDLRPRLVTGLGRQ
jgi:hypothetical protein